MMKLASILVHVPSHTDNTATLECAVRLAEVDGAKLKLVDVLPDFNWTRLWTGGSERVIEQLTQDKSRTLQELRRQIEGRGIEASTKLLDGPASVSIIQEVLRTGDDLVVRQAKGRHSRRRGFFGTTATRLIRKCPCAVLILKPGRSSTFRRIVAAVEAVPSDDAHWNLNHKIIEAGHHFQQVGEGQLEVVHAWSVYGESLLKEHMREDEFEELRRRTKAEAERHLDDLLTEYQMGIGNPNVYVLHGDGGHLIPEFARQHESDLLVMGTVGRSGVAGLLIGNTAEQILGQVDCAVLALKPAGFQSPIRV